MPIIDVAVSFPAGSARDTKATSGVAGVTRYMMTLGAGGMNEEVITNKFADIGAILGGEFSCWQCAGRTRHLWRSWRDTLHDDARRRRHE